VDEGRTIVLSSHLLDEVEKTCDYVAIVDMGQIIVQGSMAELRADGGKSLLIEVDDSSRARELLAANAAVERVVDDDGELRVVLADSTAVPALNELLVGAGIRVSRLEPTRASLEDRFLDITSRFENAA
jgi:ABC-2 type transport system ATP-binding protein